jgi:hypothetical protein
MILDSVIELIEEEEDEDHCLNAIAASITTRQGRSPQ